MKDKADIHDIHKYSFAKKVVDDVPRLIELLEQCQMLLKDDVEYRSIADVLYSIKDAKYMLEIHYKNYKTIVEDKGKV